MDGVAVPMPGRYPVEIAVMQEMQWSWQQLCEAPYDLIEEILVRREHRLRYEDIRRKKDEARSREDASAARRRGRSRRRS